MEVFPHILARIGGNSYGCLQEMVFRDLTAISMKILENECVKERLKNELSHHLYRFIGNVTKRPTQNLILNLRRDIFNNRGIKAETLSKSLEVLPHPAGELLHTYLATLHALEALKQEGAIIYLMVTEKSRSALQALASDKTLQYGLVLSSKTLLENVSNYVDKKPASFRKKEFKTELSLLKYLTRTCTKTSPFSTFTQLSVARSGVQQEIIQCALADRENQAYTSHIRLNNFLFKYLKGLIFSNKEISGHLPLRLNPTISQQNQPYHYLVNHNQIESFQQLKGNSALTCIQACLQRASAQRMTFNELVTQIHPYVNASRKEITEYLQKLINLGFLEFYLGISGTDPHWDKKLIKQLEPLAIHQEWARLLIEGLINIRENASRYAQADAGERKKLLEATLQTFKRVSVLHAFPVAEFQEAGVFADMPQDVIQASNTADASDASDFSTRTAQNESVPFPFQPENMFYEDTVKHVDITFNQPELIQFVRKLDGLLHQLQMFDFELEEKQKTQTFFLNRYGKNARVSLLHFYEDYYREFKKPESEINPDFPDSKPVHAGMNQDALMQSRRMLMADWKKAFIRKVHEKGVGQDVFHLDNELLQTLNPTIGFCPAKRSASYGAFIQFFQEKDAQGRLHLKGVLNHQVAGFGKFLSRYLHLFDEEVLKDTIAWNLKIKGRDELPVENCDNSHFNANIHPTLMPYEISSSGSHNSLRADQQIPVAGLDITYSEGDRQLVLTHRKSGKKVRIFDMGFQAGYFRSELFKLLNNFSNTETIVLSPIKNGINHAIRQAGHDASGVKISPRIVFDDTIVLKRKSWSVPRPLIPTKNAQESDWDYYCKIKGWQKSLSLPDEVFIVINSHSRLPRRKDHDTVAKDDYKPQYIDFRNPLLVRLFQMASVRVKQSMIIEEMYPTSGQMLKIGEESFVTEFLVQWYHFQN